MNSLAPRDRFEPRDVSEILARLVQLDRLREACVQEKNRLLRELAARIRKVPLESISLSEPTRQLEREVESVIARRQAICEAQLLAETDFGCGILGLSCLRSTLTDWHL